MSPVWNDLKKNLKQFGSAAAEKAEEIGKVAATKTEELTKVGKVKLEIHQLQREMDKEFAKLGKHAFDSSVNENVTNFAGNEQFFSYVQRVQDLKDRVKEKEEKLEEIKAEYEKTSSEGETEAEDAEEAESSEESGS
ncbi:MAG: hypothetical protein QF613_05970 [Candidatus Marinimicrobia bacterium]|jgi:hypothetical protein|nr:hypothetical protein [Candidatus Neomarinimicrobiota bacterium]MDP6457663.1 hypothetical protein [Candidatus Neomarinimicrobiota bacterium]MDP6593735.1 hypothetical protein [Candidatus Neomarinimicrobiota bacterium]MDP6837177.1 hypothetical protein [Candidatus Neomarinimicrobiota bacterium]MDP6966679.1 hypothetical protein [Candidatus Neomarinimicrobiota bacterium]|tara:strand:- start:3529 stop:3939 length:411 start_codon:yes stop_codon:yes gene_type:complete